MLAAMERKYYWPGMAASIQAYCNSCPDCSKAKATTSSRKDRYRATLNRIPFGVLFVDHVEIPAKNTFGYTHIVTMMCGFSKFLIAVPVTSTAAKVTERAVWDRIVCGLGRIPDVIVSDNGFDSEEWKRFCRDMGCESKNTSPYNPRANKVERPHRFLKSLLRICCENMGQSIWPMLVQTAVRAYNQLKRTNKLSPFALIFGAQADMPIEKILFRRPSPVEITEEST